MVGERVHDLHEQARGPGEVVVRYVEPIDEPGLQRRGGYRRRRGVWAERFGSGCVVSKVAAHGKLG